MAKGGPKKSNSLQRGASIYIAKEVLAFVAEAGGIKVMVVVVIGLEVVTDRDEHSCKR
jgi:hypothetical protein